MSTLDERLLELINSLGADYKSILASLATKSSVLIVEHANGTATITVDDGGPFTLIDNGDGTATISLAGESVIIDSDRGDPLFPRFSEVATLHRYAAHTGGQGGTGAVSAGRAICRKTDSYSQIRCFVSNQGAGLTGFKMGVWSSDGSTLLGETASVHASLLTNNWLTASLASPIDLDRGDVVYLGYGSTFTTTAATIRCHSASAAAYYTHPTMNPYRARSGTTWNGSSVLPGALDPNTGPTFLPLMELIP